MSSPVFRGRAVAGFFTAKVRCDGVRIYVAQDRVRGRDDPIRGVGLVGRLVETCHGVVENFSQEGKVARMFGPDRFRKSVEPARRIGAPQRLQSRKLGVADGLGQRLRVLLLVDFSSSSSVASSFFSGVAGGGGS